MTRLRILDAPLALTICLLGAVSAAAAADPAKIYDDEPKRRSFGMEDAETLGEGRLGLGLAGGYPKSKINVQFCPADFFDMGLLTEFGYEPDFFFGYYVKIQLLEDDRSIFNMGIRAGAALLWLVKENGKRADKFFFAPRLALPFGLGGGPIYFAADPEIEFDVAMQTNVKHRISLKLTGGVEWSFYEDMTFFAKAGYQFKLRGEPYSGLDATAGLNFGF